MKHLGLAIAVAALAFAAGAYFATQRGSAPGADIAGFLWPDPPQIADFALDSATGEKITTADLANKFTLLFFGFTNCPDICPTTMTTLNRIYTDLSVRDALADRIQVLFVSVDPDRDNPEQLRAYVDYFNPSFLAATANEQRLESFSRQMGVLYMKVRNPQDGSYTMDHSASLLLIGPQLRFIGHFGAPHDASAIAASVAAIAEFVEKS